MLEKEEKQTSRVNNQQAGENSRDAINNSRRKALKTLAAGTAVAGTMALTGKWSKPVVDTIILPAHAQATNPTGPTATTTPAPTTTSGECSPRLASASYIVTRDMQTGFVTAVTVSGTVTPPVAGAAIVIDFNVLHDDNSTSSNTLRATTDAAGAFSATQSYTAADQVAEVGDPGVVGPDPGVVGPCGDTMDAPPGNM